MSHETGILAPRANASSVPLPAPRVAIAVRLGTMEDLPFIDSMQKQHSKALGFFPRAQMEGYVRNQWVLVAEDAATGRVIGYCASRDRYLKRDELGAIFQLCVAPGEQRKLIGAALVREVFARSAYGCKLYCCWCAQDLPANLFWQSMGFLPIAFRAGSKGKRRVHIFWQRRIREGDTGDAKSGGTPYWFPAQTNAGAMGEDRLVLPIPPGMDWHDAMPRIFPQGILPQGILPQGILPMQKPALVNETKRASRTTQALKPRGVRLGPPPSQRLADAVTVRVGIGVGQKPKRPKTTEKTPRAKNDPQHVAAARELRDRWLEEVNSGRFLPAEAGKYDLARALPSPVVSSQLALPDAA